MQRPITIDGLFHQGDPSTGEKGTPITADWLNALLGIATFFRGATEPPAGELGDDGDFYICTVTRNIYGPKEVGEWGVAWVQGLPGARGYSVLVDGRDPGEADGINGDSWINSATLTIYGPKTGGVWGAGQALRGSQGIQGAAGGPLSAVWADVLIIDTSMDITGYDVIHLGDTNAGALVWTAPTAVGKKGRQIYLENIGTSGNLLTVNGPGGQTMGVNTWLEFDDGMGLTLYSDDANWRIKKG